MNSLASTNAQKLTSTISTASLAASHVHPFTKLPVEIMSEIFLHCLPTDSELCVPSPSHAPLLLCHVSPFWRHAALADPRLWRRLTLNPKQLQKLSSLEPLCRATKRMEEQSRLWLNNAKDLGLDMDVTVPISFWDAEYFSSESQPSPTEVSERWDGFIVPILIEQASRLRTLRLSFGVASLLHSFFFEVEGSPHPAMSRLESLMIKGEHLQVAENGDSTRPGHRSTFKRFASAPRLAKVAILVKHRIPFPLQLPRDFLPWSQLTHLMITMPCSGPFWKFVLPQCDRLEAGYINIEQSIAPEIDLDPPLPECGYISLPRLKTLDVTFHDEYTSAYFDDFRFPALRKLLVACDFGNGFPTFAWLPPAQNVNFLMQLKYLTSLTLSYQNMTEVELLGLLKYTVQLEDLVLDSYLVDHKTFFQALVVQPDSEVGAYRRPGGSILETAGGIKMDEGGDAEKPSPLLPKLRLFRFFLEYFADVPPTTFDEEDFLAVMTSRSEVAREVANNLVDEPITSKLVQEEDDASMDTDSAAYSDESDSEDDGDDEMGDEEDVMIEGPKDSNAGDVFVPPPSIFPTPTTAVGVTPSFAMDALPARPPPAPRPQLPAISKLILPICQVELSTDARDPSKFRRLESFEAGVGRYQAHVAKTPATPEFAFRLDFSSPSNWALQDAEPVWY